MPNKIKPRRSYTANSVPLTTDLETHELAINWIDGKAFTKNAAGQIVSVTLGGGGSGLTWSSVPASATATGAAGSIAYDGSYLYLAPQSNTWVRVALSTWSSFTPASVTGLQLWLDGSDASTLYDATSGGSLVAADGAVARWEDKSGNARHFTQSSSGSRPLRKTSQQNGKDTLLFDGTNDFMAGSDFLDADTGGLTAFIVYKRNATGSRHDLIVKHDTSGLGWFFRHGSAGELSAEIDVGNNVSASRATSNSVVASAYTVATWKFTAGSFRALTFHRNGVAESMAGASGSVDTPPSTSGVVRIGAQEYSGTTYFPANANFAEVILYNAALSDTDRAAVESYLMTKWAIT